MSILSAHFSVNLLDCSFVKLLNLVHLVKVEVEVIEQAPHFFFPVGVFAHLCFQLPRPRAYLLLHVTRGHLEPRDCCLQVFMMLLEVVLKKPLICKVPVISRQRLHAVMKDEVFWLGNVEIFSEDSLYLVLDLLIPLTRCLKRVLGVWIGDRLD